jgi:DNA-binding HxlR family transcriptional regulator
VLCARVVVLLIMNIYVDLMVVNKPGVITMIDMTPVAYNSSSDVIDVVSESSPVSGSILVGSDDVVCVVSESSPVSSSSPVDSGTNSIEETGDPLDEEYGKVVTGIGTEEIWKAVRKVANSDARKVTRALYLRGLNFGELKAETGLSDNDLNHALYEMKKLGLIVVDGDKKGKAKYHLTQYYVALLESLRVLKDRLGKLDDLHSAVR